MGLSLLLKFSKIENLGDKNSKTFKDQAPVVQTLDSAIQWINHYPLDNSIGFASVYPLDSDLSAGQRYPSFEQLGPGMNRRDFLGLFQAWKVYSHNSTVFKMCTNPEYTMSY